MFNRQILKSKNKGFTLIELMVSVTVFSVVMVISMGAIMTVLSANKKSQAIRAVMDNLNYSLEDMTRNIRFGSSYHCDEAVGDVTLSRDCAGGATSIVIKRSDGAQVIYRLSGTHIENTVSGSLTPSDNGVFSITSPDVTIQKLSFRVFGSPPYPDTFQPEVIITIQGYAGSKPSIQSTFNLEATLSQRKFDF